MPAESLRLNNQSNECVVWFQGTSCSFDPHVEQQDVWAWFTVCTHRLPSFISVEVKGHPLTGIVQSCLKLSVFFSYHFVIIESTESFPALVLPALRLPTERGQPVRDMYSSNSWCLMTSPFLKTLRNAALTSAEVWSPQLISQLCDCLKRWRVESTSALNDFKTKWCVVQEVSGTILWSFFCVGCQKWFSRDGCVSYLPCRCGDGEVG